MKNLLIYIILIKWGWSVFLAGWIVRSLVLFLIMITSQRRGGLDLVFMGNVAQQVVQLTDSPVFILPIIKELEN